MPQPDFCEASTMTIPTIEVQRLRQLASRALDGFNQLAVHEAGLLDEHLFALQESVAVARKARSVSELLRNQLDLIPATTARLRRNQRKRLALWRQLRQQA
jgi:hypothetical protein